MNGPISRRSRHLRVSEASFSITVLLLPARNDWWIACNLSISGDISTFISNR